MSNLMSVRQHRTGDPVNPAQVRARHVDERGVVVEQTAVSAGACRSLNPGQAQSGTSEGEE